MTPIFSRDCACEPGSFELHDTDARAADAAWGHWLRRLTFGRYAPQAALFWCVHGPSGHVVGLHDSPAGELPPLPPP